jgi:AraC-like DNA-binding protein
MTIFPQYLSEYPNMYSSFPFHLSINRLERGYVSHRHDYLEFSYVIEGQGSEIINGIEHEMKPGTFTFVLPYQIHEIHSTGDVPLRLFNCMFGMNILFDTNSDMGLREILLASDEHYPSFVQFEGEKAQSLQLVINFMLTEYNSDGIWKRALLRAKLVEVLVLFDRMRRGEPHTSGLVKHTHVQSKIWKVVNYVHQHYQDELTLTSVADYFDYSASNLSELFKKFVGNNFINFLHELRIRHACGLLTSTEMSISDIAMEVGYGSYKTFSRVFRNQKSITPQSYRINNRYPSKEC